MSGMQLAGQAALQLRSSARATARKWSRIPIHCLYCCHPVDGESVGRGGTMAWCPVCHRVFECANAEGPKLGNGRARNTADKP